tara:strand:+ start:332 stop:508 length:177 start_codon:yes stop_codon:yes gene_type:complete
MLANFFKDRRGIEAVGNLFVKIVVGILILIFVVGGLYVILGGDLMGIASNFKNIFRFR